jgi:hypothetical protein
MKPKERKLTLKQRKWLKVFFQTGNQTKATLSAYNVTDPTLASCMGSQTARLLKDAVRTIMEQKGLDVGCLVDRVQDATNATKIHSSPTEPDKEIPDHTTRLKAVEIASRWLGMEQTPTTAIQINVKSHYQNELDTYKL